MCPDSIDISPLTGLESLKLTRFQPEIRAFLSVRTYEVKPSSSTAGNMNLIANPSPVGTAEAPDIALFSRPYRTQLSAGIRYPAMNRWANIVSPYGTRNYLLCP